MIASTPAAPAKSMRVATVTPSGPRVLLTKVETGDAKIGALVLPQETKGWYPVAGTVVEPGEGHRLPETGERLGPQFKKGDTVLLARWAGVSIMIGDVEHLIVPEQEILGRATFHET